MDFYLRESQRGTEGSGTERYGDRAGAFGWRDRWIWSTGNAAKEQSSGGAGAWRLRRMVDASGAEADMFGGAGRSLLGFHMREISGRGTYL